MHDTTIGWRFVNPAMAEMYGTDGMGQTAENVARKHGVAREAQDRFAAESQRRCAAARTATGRAAADHDAFRILGGRIVGAAACVRIASDAQGVSDP